MKVTAFAPATSANVAVGFDLLGFAMQGVGDTVSVETTANAREVEIAAITGIEVALPTHAAQNTAGGALIALLNDVKADFGLRITIQKGIAMGSGMGGSSASAVAAVVAANALLANLGKIKPFSTEKLLHYALQGELVASGSIHGDNVGPSLQGGLTLVVPGETMKLIPLPTPKDVYSVVVHPDIKVETKTARGILKPEVSLKTAIAQNANLGGFIAACYRSDLDLIQHCLKDVMIESQRKHLIPGFDELARIAKKSNALGFSISGSGPSVFAWVEGKENAAKLGELFKQNFKDHKLASQSFVSSLDAKGAEVIST